MLAASDTSICGGGLEQATIISPIVHANQHNNDNTEKNHN